MILIINPASMESPNVRDEWTYAKQSHINKPIIPVLQKETMIPFGLHNLHFVDFREGRDQSRSLQQLLTALSQIEGLKESIKVDEPTGIPPEQRLQTSETKQALMPNWQPTLVQSRTNFNSAEAMIGNAKEMLWISGISISRVAVHTEAFCNLLINQGSLRFLLINPQRRFVINDTGKYVGQRPGQLRRRLKTRLEDFAYLKQNFSGDTRININGQTEIVPQVEIRTLRHRPSAGYFISDPYREQGIMTIAPFFYLIDEMKPRVDGVARDTEPPFLFLTKTQHPDWYDVYLRDFVRLWDDAAPWSH